MIRDIDAQKMVLKVAKELEKIPEIKPPDWAGFVKTGRDKERAPTQENWWWIRAASILRKVYLKQRIGVSRLRKIYGGRKNRGHKPEHKYKGSGAVIRKILQQLEAARLVKTEKGKGRVITGRGQAFLNKAAKNLS